MGRRKDDSPRKAAMREAVGKFMRENDVQPKNGDDVNSMMRDMMSIILEEALDVEMNEELGYSKYDYKNKEGNNSRNGYSRKTMHTNHGDMELKIPLDRKLAMMDITKKWTGRRKDWGQIVSQFEINFEQRLKAFNYSEILDMTDFLYPCSICNE